MLASAIVAGVAAGRIAGGTFSRLGQLEISGWPLLLGAVLLRVGAPGLGELAAAAYVLGFAGIVATAYLNRALAGMPLIALGALLNLVVVAANGGMPVDQGALTAAGVRMPSDHLHIVLDGSSRLPLLADWIPTPVFRSVYSPGDFVLATGGFWVPFAWMRRK